MSKSNKYARQLAELGFIKDGKPDLEGHVIRVLAMVEAKVGKLSRRDRRKVMSNVRRDLKNNPSYTITMFPDGHAITEASDEIGQLWRIAGAMDLSLFGFFNNAAWVAEHLASIRSTVH